MAILKIAKMGHPVLKRTADPVSDPKAPEIHRLIADMVDTLADAPGIGLSAPQVHVPKRVVIFHIPQSRAGNGDEDEANEEAADEEETEAVPMTVLINPEIEVLAEEKVTGAEGCLSLPGMIGMVPRFTHIRYKALALDGFHHRARGEGLSCPRGPARVRPSGRNPVSYADGRPFDPGLCGRNGQKRTAPGRKGEGDEGSR